jgi:large subunit ribosomal protein L1
MAFHSKRYRGLHEKVKTKEPVSLTDAIKQLKAFNTTKFDQTVEVSTNLGIDPRQSDQNVRGSVGLPNGIGKSVRVAVFAQGENAEKATAAGADIVGGDDLAQRIKGGFMDFDVALATPDMMGVVGPLGRVLGPRGLMPSPRAGTVTTDIATAVREFKAGKIEFRNDKGGNVAAPVGKLSFSEAQLQENITTFLKPPEDGQAGRRQGDLHPLGHDLGHHEPRHPGPGLNPAVGSRRSAGGSRRTDPRPGWADGHGDPTPAPVFHCLPPQCRLPTPMSKYVKELMIGQLKGELDGTRSVLILDFKGLDAVSENQLRLSCAGNRSGCGR